MATGLRPFSERSADGTPLLDTDNGEELMHVEPNVSIVLASHPPQSPGTLYISTKKVVWLSDADRAKGYSVDFVSISLHAVSRDPEAFVSPCIYTQIDNGEDEDESEGSDSESSETLDLSKITEMRLVPSDATQLDTLFAVFCECAELNPEPVEEEEQHNWIFSADQLGAEIEETTPHGMTHNFLSPLAIQMETQDLASSVLELQINDQRFEDADEMVSDDSDEHHQ